jgi:hypothetical protein
MRLTPELLRRIVLEEASKMKFGKMRTTKDAAKETEEVDADELADSLENQVNYAKALKLEEARLRKRLKRIAETRGNIARTISRLVL